MINRHDDNAGLDRETEQAADRVARALMGEDPVAAARRPMERERSRVTKLLRSDRLYAADEAARQAAEMEIRTGVYVSVNEAVVPPTPEWLAKHDTAPVTVQADGEGHHARSVKTVRRVVTSHPKRAYDAGKINERQLKACAWYREQYDEAGLEGRMPSSQVVDRIRSGLTSTMPFGDWQLEAMDELRHARKAIAAKYRRFFDMVVLEDMPVKRASRAAKCRRDPFLTLRTCADSVADYLGLDPH